MRFYTFTFSLKKGLANIGDYTSIGSKTILR